MPESRARRRQPVRPRVKVWLESDGEHVFCSGLCRILDAVELSGSIKEAAGIVGLSYRHVWAQLKRAEQALGSPLVDAQVGGHGHRRTMVSELGNSLRNGYRRMQTQMTAASDQFAAELKDLLPPPRPR